MRELVLRLDLISDVLEGIDVPIGPSPLATAWTGRSRNPAVRARILMLAVALARVRRNRSEKASISATSSGWTALAQPRP